MRLIADGQEFLVTKTAAVRSTYLRDKLGEEASTLTLDRITAHLMHIIVQWLELDQGRTWIVSPILRQI